MMNFVFQMMNSNASFTSQCDTTAWDGIRAILSIYAIKTMNSMLQIMDLMLNMHIGWDR